MDRQLAVGIKAPSGAKLEFSLERKIEAAWEQAQEAEWSYLRFCNHLFAILIVLRKRDRWTANAANTQKKKKSRKKGAPDGVRPAV